MPIGTRSEIRRCHPHQTGGQRDRPPRTGIGSMASRRHQGGRNSGRGCWCLGRSRHDVDHPHRPIRGAHRQQGHSVRRDGWPCSETDVTVASREQGFGAPQDPFAEIGNDRVGKAPVAWGPVRLRTGRVPSAIPLCHRCRDDRAGPASASRISMRLCRCRIAPPPERCRDRRADRPIVMRGTSARAMP